MNIFETTGTIGTIRTIIWKPGFSVHLQYSTKQNEMMLTNREWVSSRRITSIVQLVTVIGQKSIQLHGVRKNGCIISNDQERRNSQI